MTTYRVLSPLVGTPGEIYNPEIYVNLNALISGGFIEAITDEPTPADEKPAKTKSKKTDQE
jgi:hypothetical protein